jgi:hypothetical protein
MAPRAGAWIVKRNAIHPVKEQGNRAFTEYTISLAELERLEQGNQPRAK